jgi:hypothetical protein
MNFADLYRQSNTLTTSVTPLRVLIDIVKSQHLRVGDVEIWACDLNEDISLGHMIYRKDRSSPYDEPYDVPVIRVSKKLNRCWRRIVCCKELMHVFDDSAAQTSDGGKFLKLLKELEGRNNILPGDASAMLLSERHTEWMALIVLCPPRLRAMFEGQYKKTIDDRDIAEKVKIPECMIPAVMGDYYWRALERLTGEARPPAVKKGHPA